MYILFISYQIIQWTDFVYTFIVCVHLYNKQVAASYKSSSGSAKACQHQIWAAHKNHQSAGSLSEELENITAFGVLRSGLRPSPLKFFDDIGKYEMNVLD